MAASRTAEYVALYRALETVERRREPVFRDPFARRFLTGARRFAFWLARMPGLRGPLERYAERRAPGARASCLGRTRFIDDLVRIEMRRGTRQLVILGAGYDSRAHRLTELSAIPVFEVDRAEIQAAKQRRLAGASGVRTDVRYVAADFEVHHLATQLADAGWRADRRSLFLWEGVTNYLDEAAVISVLDTVGRSAADSAIAFTYIHRGAIDGSGVFPGAELAIATVKQLGEPWRFGLIPDGVPAFLAPVGLALEQDLGADEYRGRYGVDAAGYAFYRIAVARVRDGATRPR